MTDSEIRFRLEMERAVKNYLDKRLGELEKQLNERFEDTTRCFELVISTVEDLYTELNLKIGAK